MAPSSRRDNPQQEEQGNMLEVSQLQQLLDDLQAMRDTLHSQNATIVRLQSQLQQSSERQSPSTSNTFKAPPVSTFSGKASDRMTERVMNFCYSVKMCGKLCNYSEQKMLDLAKYLFQDRAASWILRLERENIKPKSLEELQKAMIAEFVPENEQAIARDKRMDYSVKDYGCMDSNIAQFEYLVTRSGPQRNEADMYDFNRFPKKYQGKCAERFPTSQPTDHKGNASMHQAYDYARALELSFKLAVEQINSLHKDQGLNRNKMRMNCQSSAVFKEGSSVYKDPNAISWGPMKRREFGIYRKNDRCGRCGKKGWSDPSHPCREGRTRDKSSNESKKRLTSHRNAATEDNLGEE